MKKNKNKGFLLTELLVTATLVATVLIFLYAQFYNIKRSYDNSFKYNTVNDLYALDNVRSFLIDGGYIDTYIQMATNHEILTTYPYLELTTFISNDYFSSIISIAKIRKLYFTRENLSTFVSYLNNNINMTNSANFEKLRRFVNYIDYDTNNSTGYRLIAEFNDDTFSTLLVGGE